MTKNMRTLIRVNVDFTKNIHFRKEKQYFGRNL